MENKDTETKYMEFPFEIKEVLEDGTFIGYASTFGGVPDSYGDIVARGAFSETIANGGRNGTGVAMLWQHKYDEPIGTWPLIEENNRGLKVVGKLTRGVQRADEAYLLMKDGAVRGLSIGYKALDFEYNKDRSVRTLKKIDLAEISPVSFPANTRATITQVKALVEEAKDERELENALRDVGMSKNSAQYIVSLCKDKLFPLRESEDDGESKEEIEITKVVEEDKVEPDFELLLDSLKNDIKKANEKFVMESKKVVPYKAWTKAPMSASWDGNAEVRKADVKDLKIMCTWYDADNPDIKSSYKLPHHRAANYVTVWRGVAAAMAALLGARGGVNIPSSEKRGVYNHLKKHYAQFDKEAPEFRTDYTILELKKLFPEMFD